MIRIFNILGQVTAETPSQGFVNQSATETKELVQTIYQYLAEYGLKIIAALVIFIVGRWIAKLVSGIIHKSLQRSSVEATLSNFLSRFAYFGIMVFVIVAALAKLGVQTASIIAVVGAAGLAVGLALQGSLANFAAGILLLIFRPFKVGDFVEVGSCMGTVTDIHIFNTILNSPDNVRVIIPNSQVTGGNIRNYTINGTRRIDMVVGVSYGDHLGKVKDVITKVVAADSRVLADPLTTVAVSELGESSVNFVVRPWVKVADYWAVRFDLTQKIKETLDAEGISIPFPQRDIHIKDGNAVV